MELALKWREQKTHLQNRVTSLGSALQLVDSTERSITEISDRLDTFINEPKDITAHTLTHSNILKDIKTWTRASRRRWTGCPASTRTRATWTPRGIATSARGGSDPPRVSGPSAAAGAQERRGGTPLDRFLDVAMHCGTRHRAGAGTPGPCDDAALLQETRAKLAQVRPGVESLREKAPQLDRLLEGGRLAVTRDAPWGRDQKLLTAAEKQGLREPTIPAVQQRVRALQDLEAQLSSLQPEVSSLKEAAAHENTELDTLWEETQRAVTDRQEQCTVLMELLKKFQSCRSYLGNVLQRAEHTINESRPIASYMGKDNLQRLITTVHGIKDELSGLGAKMEEIRAVCRQLQSHLKKIPDCKETPFEGEADALVDTWLM
ncbi:hypothetical protein AALO_G00000720 [Alosa alosa]|uniref:Uncharacterized protein n=1 Tax=Alosa alosa TaxID=278164 RepID=A0AAV6HFE7_9TELE|nr:hypothetical protein AALO_G00000720 [Alosa alosa]